MELWIRSQDKTILSKAQNIIIRENQNENNETNYAIVDIYTMGIYKSKERALEVLDEIQKLLQPQTIINYENELEFHPEYTIQNVIKTIPKTEIKELSTYVYEMPQE